MPRKKKIDPSDSLSDRISSHLDAAKDLKHQRLCRDVEVAADLGRRAVEEPETAIPAIAAFSAAAIIALFQKHD